MVRDKRYRTPRVKPEYQEDTITLCQVGADSSCCQTFTVCDLYEVLCYDLLIQGADCDSLMTSSRTYKIEGLSMYPNPAYNQLTIDLSASMHDTNGMQYRIINIMGQHLAGGIFTEQVQRVDISSLGAGTYYLQLITTDGGIDCRPFVKIE